MNIDFTPSKLPLWMVSFVQMMCEFHSENNVPKYLCFCIKFSINKVAIQNSRNLHYTNNKQPSFESIKPDLLKTDKCKNYLVAELWRGGRKG